MSRAAGALFLVLAVTASPIAAEEPAPPAAFSEDAFSDEAFEALKAIRATQEEMKSSRDAAPLASRLLAAAKRAYSENRFNDAVGIAAQARESMARARKLFVQKTPATAPTTDAILDAMARLAAAEAAGSNDPRVPTARELINTAEAALMTGRITQADQFARRAVEMLSALPAALADTETLVTRVNVNTASRSELSEVVGMTEPMIENLLWFRERIGPIHTLRELKFVPGFSDDFLAIAESRLSTDAP